MLLTGQMHHRIQDTLEGDSFLVYSCWGIGDAWGLCTDILK